MIPADPDLPDIVIIQNPTPPDWTRLYKDQPLIGHSIDYPFGENSNAKVIVPQQFLKTYQDFYTANHPEVQWGYMSAYYDRGWQKSTGFIVGGGPIYSEDGLIGCWYVRNGHLRVIYNVCTIPVYGEGEAPWNSVLGEVEYMDITILDAFLNIPIAFPGLCENNTVDEILLIEVKTNTSQLSSREKEIREAVKSGRIRYVEYRIDS